MVSEIMEGKVVALEMVNKRIEKVTVNFEIDRKDTELFDFFIECFKDDEVIVFRRPRIDD